MCDSDIVGRLIEAPPAESELPQRGVEFYVCIARESTNALVVENLDQTLARMQLYSVYGQSGAAEEAWQEHRVISEAISARDPDAAAQAMRAHLSSGLGRIRKAVG